MKKKLVFIFIFLLIGLYSAPTFGSTRDVASLFVTANDAYESGKYAESIDLYKEIIGQGFESVVTLDSNQFDGFRHALHATTSQVVASENTIKRFLGTALVIVNPDAPPRVVNNTAYTDEKQAQVVQLSSEEAELAGNVVKPTSAIPKPKKENPADG